MSAGFDHDAFIWSPFVNTLLFTLKGHTSSLVGCQCVEGTNELVTADSSGVFKIWDLRNFMCCQTFTSEHEQGGEIVRVAKRRAAALPTPTSFLTPTPTPYATRFARRRSQRPYWHE